MLAKRVDELPPGEEWIFEPKWDGFRALIFRDGDEILIQSRDEKPLNRYFPELLDSLQDALPARCVLDGEIVIVKDNELDFDLCNCAFIPPLRASICFPNKLPRQSSSSTCFAKEIGISGASPFKLAASGWKRCCHRRSPRSI